FMKHVGIFNLSTEPESVPIVADLQCDYQKQVYFDEHLKLYVKVDNVGNSSMDIHYMALNQQEDICFTGRGKIVNINATTVKANNQKTNFTDKKRARKSNNEK